MNDEEKAAALREQIAEHVATQGTRKPSKKVWTAPTEADFGHGTVLAFDQTVTKTGYAVVRHGHDGLHVLDGNLIVPKAGNHLLGFEQTLVKSVAMEQALNMVLMLVGGSIDVVVHEMPAVTGYRIESSLLGAHAVRVATLNHARGVPVRSVSNQAMRAVLNTPEERHEKKYVGIAVNDLIPRERRTTQRWNQDVHDAVGLALTYLYQKAQKA